MNIEKGKEYFEGKKAFCSVRVTPKITRRSVKTRALDVVETVGRSSWIKEKDG